MLITIIAVRINALVPSQLLFLTSLCLPNFFPTNAANRSDIIKIENETTVSILGNNATQMTADIRTHDAPFSTNFSPTSCGLSSFPNNLCTSILRYGLNLLHTSNSMKMKVSGINTHNAVFLSRKIYKIGIESEIRCIPFRSNSCVNVISLCSGNLLFKSF